jgi:hypothetical protein
MKNRAFKSIWEINVDKCGYLKVHDFTDRCPKKCTILPIDSAYHYAKQPALLLYRRNPSYCGSMAVIRRKRWRQHAKDTDSTTVGLSMRLTLMAPFHQQTRSAGRTPGKLDGCLRYPVE